MRNRHRHAVEQASRRWRERAVKFDFHTGEEIPHTWSATGRRYVPQKYSWIENNWVDGGNPLRVVADRSIVVEATYVSKTRLTCKAPSFDFPTHEEVAHKFRTSCLFDRFSPGP